MNVADRLKRAAAGVADALGVRRRPGVELVRVDPAMPPPPRPLRALPAPEPPLCRRCGTRHEPRPHPAAGGGLAAAYGRTLDPDPYSTRSRPLGRAPAHDKAIVRDQANPWRHGTGDPPPPSLDLAELREDLYAPRIPWWEQREH